ncbi:hypothetical protein LCGC14_0693640 [marine sediment metagenome]|uniref:GIY-YIG domain-containing protein n=1 Tax=marine sediment metagenome TaxID=412755 RepID=A0A0F9TSM7_9ZZZZ
MSGRTQEHVIYGLYQKYHPRNILYVGSWPKNKKGGPAERLHQHQAGECRTTVKCAARDGVPLESAEILGVKSSG